MQSARLSQLDAQRVQQVALLLEQGMHTPATIAQLAGRVGWSESKLKKVFKAYYGMPPYTYLLGLRMKKAQMLLLEQQSIKFIAAELGYRSESNFCKAFRLAFNESPRSWMKKRAHQLKLPVS